MVHAENADMIDVLQKKCIAAGKGDPYYHAVSRPPVAEAEATRRAIYLAETTDAPIYIAHVTCREAVDEIASAIARGQSVLGETCSHYLTLDESNLAKPRTLKVPSMYAHLHCVLRIIWNICGMHSTADGSML